MKVKKRCPHCGGNIILTYAGYKSEKFACLQCGRDHDHRCNWECEAIKEKKL